jgi:hypothetical protein
MTEDTKPITTQFAKPDRTVEVGAHPTAGVETASGHTAVARDQSGDQKIKVRALRTFHEQADMKGKMVAFGDEFETSRDRAAQLRANGLIEYVDASHAKDIHGEEGAKKIEERVKREQEMTKIPERNLGTPLRNPELKLAEVDPKTDPKAKAAEKAKADAGKK